MSQLQTGVRLKSIPFQMTYSGLPVERSSAALFISCSISHGFDYVMILFAPLKFLERHDAEGEVK